MVGIAALSLQAQAEQARTTFGVTDAEVDRVAAAEAARWQQVQQLEPTQLVDDESRRASPGDVSSNQVEKAKSRPAPTPGEGLEIIRDSEKKIVLQVEKLLGEQLGNVVKRIVSAIPILEPLLAAFMEAVDKSLQARVEKAYQRLVQAVLYGSAGDYAEATAQEARTLVAETDVSGPVHNHESRATDLAREWRATADTVDAGGIRLANQIDSVVNELINELGGSRPENAAARLYELDAALTEPHVQRLASTMRDSSSTMIRHNAAVVLGQLHSPHVTESMRQEALSICGCH